MEFKNKEKDGKEQKKRLEEIAFESLPALAYRPKMLNAPGETTKGDHTGTSLHNGWKPMIGENLENSRR